MREKKTTCQVYVSDQSAWCRNKVFRWLTTWDGHGEIHYGVCKKHFIEQLRAFEKENPRLAEYMEYRHLLEEE